MDSNFKEKLLLDLAATQKAMCVQIEEIKQDLKEHIKRSNQNELLIQALDKKQVEDLSYVKKHIFAVQVVAGSFSLVAIILTILDRLKIL